MKHQKYTFSDLRKDIENSDTKEFNYTDLCVMLVNEPFFLSVEHCRIVIRFIFDKKKLGGSEKITSSSLIVKLRRFV